MPICYTCVPQSTYSVIEQCGSYRRTAKPGFNWVLCCIGEGVAGHISLRVQQLDVRCETKTKDNVFVVLTVSIQYQVIQESVYDAFYKLTDPHSQIKAYVFDVVRATVPRIELDNVFLMKDQIAHDVKEELTKSMAGFGFQIIQTLVTDIDVDARVKTAMNEINASSRLREATVQKAEAEKIQVITAAQAEAESKYLQGTGIARQRQAIINGLRASVVEFQSEIHDVNSRDVLEMMLMTQYFDVLKDVGISKNNTTVFLPHSPGAVADIGAQIRNGILQGQAPSQAAPGNVTMQR
jgi:regulator of protease activity HflC (stomatin/prohibitin superfamily)